MKFPARVLMFRICVEETRYRCFFKRGKASRKIFDSNKSVNVVAPPTMHLDPVVVIALDNFLVTAFSTSLSIKYSCCWT